MRADPAQPNFANELLVIGADWQMRIMELTEEYLEMQEDMLFTTQCSAGWQRQLYYPQVHVDKLLDHNNRASYIL